MRHSVIVIICLIAIAAGETSTTNYFVEKRKSSFTITKSRPLYARSVIASITYEEAMNTTGWDILNLTTNGKYSDADQAYAAGFAEGYATYKVSWYTWLNMFGEFPNGTINPNPLNPKIVAFLVANDKWVAAKVNSSAASDDLWYQVGLEMLQFDGLLDGLNAAAPADPKLRFTREMLLALVGVGDWYDLMNIFEDSHNNWQNMTPNEFKKWFARRSRCSALIKVAADFSDIFFAHDTWSMYNNMLRIYKHYTLNYDSKRTRSKQISFSSYPAALSSVDDFYMTDMGLAIGETTVSVMNMSIYKGNVVPESLMYWVRVMVASRLATSAEEWVSIFKQFNSGTYNNQWFVLDMKKFTPQKPLLNGTLYIAEQIPGMVGIQDVTATLQYGYWPSYNIPSIPRINEAEGYPDAVKKRGPHMVDYQTCVRAQIFRQRQADVKDMAGFQKMMQYNEYETDPMSLGDPVYSIASRGDLMTEAQGGAMCFGAVDVKATSWSLYQKGREVLIFGGPTPQQKVFDFTNTNATGHGCAPRHGVPDRWDFDWLRVAP